MPGPGHTSATQAARGPRLSINGKWLSQPITGTQRFAHELTRRLVETFPGSFVVHAPADATVPDWLVGNADVRRSRLRGTAFEQVALPVASRSELLVSFGGPAPIVRRRQVVTMHDASVFRYPQTYSRAFVLWYRLLYSVLVRRVRAVLTVSEFSANDLAEVLGVPRELFTVVPNGSDHVDHIEPRPPAGTIPPAFVLCVGTLARHKNLRPTLVAFAAAGIDTVVVGAAATSRVFDAADIGGRGAVMAGPVSDEELAWLYRHAEALVFPSFYEGFGLPVVEAQRLGCPVITSSAASLREVGGDGALYFDPASPDGAVEAIQQLRSDTQLRAELIARGKDNAERYLWARSANVVRGLLGLEEPSHA